MGLARVRLGFRNSTDNEIANLGLAVAGRMDGNPRFPEPPVPIENVRAMALDLKRLIAIRPMEGIKATADKNKKRNELIQALHNLGSFVNIVANGDYETVTASGFPARSQTRSRVPCEKVHIKKITNGRTTELIVAVWPVKNAQSYELRYSIVIDGVTQPWKPSEPFTNSRSMRISGLIPGQVYAFQVRAVGGSERFGDWSDVSSHMCM
jgi:hypothetical protein